MSADEFDDFEPTSHDTVKAGRGAPFTDCGTWVVLAQVVDRRKGCARPISHLACRVYWILRAHVDQSRMDMNGKVDERVWPGQDEMAAMVGVSKYDTIGEAIKDLVDIGAVTVESQRHPRNPMRRRNVYTVHREPPTSYAGPLSTSAWHARRKAERDTSGTRATCEAARRTDARSGGRP